MITVAIADDHPVFRRGLRELLIAEGSYDVVAEVADGTDVAGAVEEHRPDVVLLDLGLPGADGLTVTKELIARHPECRILIVTLHDDASLASRCLEAGAMGYVAKHADVAELLRAVAAVAAGQVILGSSVAVARTSARMGSPDPLDHLTARERDVLSHLAEGLSNPAIARKLELSPKTVRNLVSSVLAKLGVADRTSAAIRYRDLTRDI